MDDDADGWGSPWADDTTTTTTTAATTSTTTTAAAPTITVTKKHDDSTAAKSKDPWADSFGETSAWATTTTTTSTEPLSDWAVANTADDDGPGLWAAAGVKGFSPGPGNGYEQWGAGSEWGAASSIHEGSTHGEDEEVPVPVETPQLDLELQKPVPPTIEEVEWSAASDVLDDVAERAESSKIEPDVETATSPVLEKVEMDGSSFDQTQEVGLDIHVGGAVDGGVEKVTEVKEADVEEAEVEEAEEGEIGQEKEEEAETVVVVVVVVAEVGERSESAEVLPETSPSSPTREQSEQSEEEEEEEEEREEEDRDSPQIEPPAAPTTPTTTAIHTDVNGSVTEVELSSDTTQDKPPADTQVHDEESSDTEDAGGDDDFGDFAEEAEFDDFVGTEPEVQPEAVAPSSPPPPPPPPSDGVPAFNIDISLVRKLYPIPTSSPDPPPVEGEVIHTTGARKAWYRLTQDGTLRKKNAVDDDDYVRVTWPGSNVQGEVHKIVAKWLTETQSTGGHGRKSVQNLSSMFGWGAGSSPSPSPISSEANKRLSLGTPKIVPALQTHSRHTSESGLRTPPLPLNTSTVPPSIQRSSVPSPLTPHFGWASSSNHPSPLAKASFSGHNSPFEKSSFDVLPLSAANSRPASRRVSLTLGRGTRQNSPTVASFASSAMASGPPTPKMQVPNDVAPEPPAKDEIPPTTQVTSSMDDWGNSFDSFNKPCTPSVAVNAQPASQSSDDWGAFEALVSTPSKATTPLPRDSGDGWAAFESIKPTSPPALPSSPASPISSRNSTISSRPDSVISTKKPVEIAKQLPPAPETTNKPLPPQPSALSIAINNDHDLVRDDDEWGEMQSPTKSVDNTSRMQTPVPMSLPSHSAKPSISSDAGMDLFAGLGGSLFNGLDAFSTNTSTVATGLGSNGTAFSFGGSATTTSITAAPASTEWDLSFFDKPSQPPAPPPPVRKDLWDAPVPPTPTKGKREMEEGEIIKKIIDGLPDLSYMLA